MQENPFASVGGGVSKENDAPKARDLLYLFCSHGMFLFCVLGGQQGIAGI